MKPADVAGRWTSDRIWQLSRAGANCDAGDCGLTLDIVACGDSYCGVEVGKDGACGATALTFDAGKAEDSGAVIFSGKLELARGTEPYVVEAYLKAPPAEDPVPLLHISGDTGGEFRAFRRSFPFHATLERKGEASCTAEKKPVS
jgi:hypothetical protein